jgi:hypothetical protein
MVGAAAACSMQHRRRLRGEQLLWPPKEFCFLRVFVGRMECLPVCLYIYVLKSFVKFKLFLFVAEVESLVILCAVLS